MRKNRFSFGSYPTIKARRTVFDLSHGLKSSMNVGTLYPMYLQEIVPGDTFKVKSSFVARVTSSFLKPVMDQLYLDTYYFFVPNRLVFDDWEKFFGSDEPDEWSTPQNVSVPCVNGVVSPGSVADYLGLPVGVNFSADKASNGYLNALPFKAFAKIYNDWFRDENLIDSCFINKASDVSELNDDDWSPTNIFGKLPKVAKYHDYFTSCLPGTQKGQPVSVGGSSVPVNTVASPSAFQSGNILRFGLQGPISNFTSGGLQVYNVSGSASSNLPVRAVPEALSNDSHNPVNGSNLVVDVPPISVNDLRTSFQLQKYLEKNARGGTRYTEFILSHFGVQSPDSRLQRAEFLGGNRQPLSIQQVASTNGASGANLAELGAYSLSNGFSGFNKGFVEHGFVIGVCCIRYKHTYQQGVERMWFRNSLSDYYDPLFANLSEQPVYQSEIFNSSVVPNLKNDVFGYNEAFADMRYRPNIVTGQMRSSDGSDSLDIWHFADEYSDAPILSQGFIEETPNFVDRALAVPSSTSDQFILDFYHKISAIREMPMYSTPGLVDHH